MSVSSLAPQPKLRGKWVFIVVTALLLLGVFSILSCSVVEWSVSLNYFDFHITTPFDWLLEAILEGDFNPLDLISAFRSIFITLISGSCLPCVSLLLLPLIPLSIYVLEGYKLRGGSLLLSLTLLLMPLYQLYCSTLSLWAYLSNTFDFESLIDTLFENPHLLISMFFQIVSVALFVIAAAAVAFVPKAGKFVAAACLLFNLFSPLLVVVSSNFPYLVELFEELFISSQIVSILFSPCSVLSWMMVMMLVMMLINRTPSVLDKPKTPADKPTESATADDDSTVAESDSAPSDTQPASSVANSEADMIALYKLRTSGEISAEEYRRLRDVLAQK